MAKGAYIGIGGKAAKIKKIYFGVGGKAVKVKKAYIGVNGVARLWWSLGYKLTKYGVYSNGPAGTQTCWNNNYAIFINDGSSGAKGGQAVNSSFTTTSLAAYPNLALSDMTGGKIGDYALLWSGDYTTNGGDSFNHNNTAYYWNSSLTMGAVSNAANYNYGSKCCNIGNYMLLVGGKNITGQASASYKYVRAINSSLVVSAGLSDVSEGGAYVGGSNGTYALFVGASNTTKKVIYNSSLQVQSLSITNPYTSINYHGITGNDKYIMIAGGTTDTANYLSTVNAYDQSMTKYTPNSLNVGTHYSGNQAISLDVLSAFVGGSCSGTPGRNLGVNVYDYELTKTMPEDLQWSYSNNTATAKLGEYIMQKDMTDSSTTVLNVYKLDS